MDSPTAMVEGEEFEDSPIACKACGEVIHLVSFYVDMALTAACR